VGTADESGEPAYRPNCVGGSWRLMRWTQPAKGGRVHALQPVAPPGPRSVGRRAAGGRSVTHGCQPVELSGLFHVKQWGRSARRGPRPDSSVRADSGGATRPYGPDEIAVGQKSGRLLGRPTRRGAQSGQGATFRSSATVAPSWWTAANSRPKDLSGASRHRSPVESGGSLTSSVPPTCSNGDALSAVAAGDPKLLAVTA
jgi:hypothetical protein